MLLGGVGVASSDAGAAWTGLASVGISVWDQPELERETRSVVDKAMEHRVVRIMKFGFHSWDPSPAALLPDAVVLGCLPTG